MFGLISPEDSEDYPLCPDCGLTLCLCPPEFDDVPDEAILPLLASEDIVNTTPIETWQATPELRWSVRTKEALEPDTWGGLVYGHTPKKVQRQYQVLQQRWYCRENGSEDWRDIPVFQESKPG